MQYSVLGSGSRGNAVLVEHEGTGILIDAGFSGKELIRRAALIGKDLTEVRALFLTHEHHDHISGAGVLSRRLRLPVYSNIETLRAGEKTLKKLHKRVEFTTGDAITIGALEVRSFRTSHDTADPVGYVISDGESSFGYLTDTGTITHLMSRRLYDCNALLLEFNHDLEMLKNGPYPLSLQQRVRSSRGHLCNDDAAAFLTSLVNREKSFLRHITIGHISEKNNTANLAFAAASAAVNGGGIAANITVTTTLQDAPLSPVVL